MRIRVTADFFAPSGYGSAAREYVRALLTVGLDVEVRLSRHDMTQLPLEYFKAHEFWGPRMNDLFAQRQCGMNLFIETPEFFRPEPGIPNVGLIFWETDRLPDTDMNGNPRNNWVKQFNQMDAAIVSTRFNTEVLSNSGVHVPIHACPIPIDIDDFSPGEKVNLFQEGEGEVTKDKTIFLSLFQLSKRKNMEGLITSWVRAMGNKDDALLVIKSYRNSSDKDRKYLEDTISRIKKSTGVDSKKNIRLIHGVVPQQDLPKLYRACDVFVSVPYGEGFGKPALEAMACGKPVIYTNASSLPDFCMGYPVKATPEPVYGMEHMPWYRINQNWWRPDPYAICNALEAAQREAQEETILSLGSRCRQKVESFYTYEKVGARLASILQETHGLATAPAVGEASLA